jgi:hypothetical protein
MDFCKNYGKCQNNWMVSEFSDKGGSPISVDTDDPIMQNHILFVMVLYNELLAYYNSLDYQKRIVME